MYFLHPTASSCLYSAYSTHFCPNTPLVSSVQLWDTERADGNISLVHSSSMRPFNWGYTQFSQFNADDTLLLVSGVYLGPHHSSSGEIAVISLGRTVRQPSFLENESFFNQDNTLLN